MVEVTAKSGYFLPGLTQLLAQRRVLVHLSAQPAVLVHQCLYSAMSVSMARKCKALCNVSAYLDLLALIQRLFAQTL